MCTDYRATEFPQQQPSDDAHSMRAAPVRIDWDRWLSSTAVGNFPALPFPPDQVFMPGEVKQLHLFEARYLALFETVVLRYEKRCAHVLIDAQRSAMAAIGTVISVRNWKRLDVGVSVHVEAVARLRTSRLISSSPFLRGEFENVQDHSLSEAQLIAARLLEVRFWHAFRAVVSLSLQIGIDPIRQIHTASQTMQMSNKIPQPTQLSNHLLRDHDVTPEAVKPPTFEGKKQFYESKLKHAASRAINYTAIDFVSQITDDQMLARRLQGLSFAGWDYFPSGPALRQKAIEERNTLARFTTVVHQLEDYSRRLAAQLALQRAFPA
ncbi:unnamed protein product [Agarophyton chilense]